ncbi:carboxylesterase family protein [Paraglaciecola aquimarina]|uniref:Carboxylic ester hydrolase n=1 Tax=Paraglaciecola aquimarina TaxID=1235557 RepID=A0ABU3SUJ2_9ALTE|nr:carboxylesterase family protein [Paraglaciecola aquimarina]MDU0353686.1 carboxylesterase family protein [Paraglaciecola aquimarina]
MMGLIHTSFLVLMSLLVFGCSQVEGHLQPNIVKVAEGTLQGTVDSTSGVRSFKGVPFAKAPVGELRWRPPQPATNWQGVKSAKQFGNRCMQRSLYSDMQFRDSGTSEDCLFLNVWTPAEQSNNLPVLVYFYGGGFAAGDGSEKRYDGANMATKGIVTVTVNYRLGVFGLLAHPQLSKASGYGGSGNYTFMDQAAALQWVKRNIHAFGGNPDKITIAGESAGSFSVSALMASPLSRDMISGAIGESGSLLAGRLTTLTTAENWGEKLVDALIEQEQLISNNSIAQLRQVPAKKLLTAVAKTQYGRFSATIDKYVIPKNIIQMYQQGEYAKVPLLAGNNSQEGSYRSILQNEEPTVDNYRKAVKRRYPRIYQHMLSLYPAESSEQVKDAAQAIASDEFISLSTWNWMNVVSKTNQNPNYYYHYDHVRPQMKAQYWTNKWPQGNARGATHSAEIEYALGNLDVNPLYHWRPEDYLVSKTIQQYFINFIKTGNPNSKGLVKWPPFEQNKQLVIGLKPYAQDNHHLHHRYTELNRLISIDID